MIFNQDWYEEQTEKMLEPLENELPEYEGFPYPHLDDIRINSLPNEHPVFEDPPF